jgi:hypothetical protein
MRESREDSVDLKGITGCGLEIIVEFAYTGILELNSDNVEEVLAAATHLQINDAVKLCSKYLESSITVGNCVDILNLAELYSLTTLHLIGKKFILENFETVSDTEQYYTLLSSQLSSLLQENSLNVTSEYLLFKMLLRWIDHSPVEREGCIAALMRNIRLPLLSGEELVEKVSKVPVMMQNRECAQLLTDAKDYHIVVGKQSMLQTIRTQVRSDMKSIVMCHAQNLEHYTLKTKRRDYLKDTMVPLYNPAVIVVDNFMYTCGGKYDSSQNEIATARCFRYDARFDRWYDLAAMNEPRKDFVLVAVDHKLYAIAGQDENKVMYTMECFDIAKNEWEFKCPLDRHLYGHAGSVCLGKIYVSGGQTLTGSTKKFLCYDPLLDNWEERSPMLQMRMNHSMAEVQNNLYVIGGNVEDNYGFPVPVIAIEKYCPVANQWTLCQRSLNIREAGVCVIDQKIYIVGGINGEHYLSTLIQLYDPLRDEIGIVESFTTRIYGRSCAVLVLPRCFV